MAREIDQTLLRICLEQSPRSYLEIGTREGASLKTVLTYSTLDLVVVCDTWGRRYGGTGRGDHKHIEKMLEQFNGEVIYLDGKSQEMIPSLQRCFDLILIDGDHSKEVASADLKNCWRLLEPGGCLIMDDIVLHPALLDLCESWQVRADCEEIMRETGGNGNLILQKTGF